MITIGKDKVQVDAHPEADPAHPIRISTKLFSPTDLSREEAIQLADALYTVASEMVDPKD